MNERIKELAKQAGDYVNEVLYTAPVRSKTPGKIWEDGHISWHTQFNEKFAQLIVKECADICYHHSNAAGGVDTHFGYGYKDCGDDIKRNFGVKE
jgi:hypothetical protein